MNCWALDLTWSPPGRCTNQGHALNRLKLESVSKFFQTFFHHHSNQTYFKPETKDTLRYQRLNSTIWIEFEAGSKRDLGLCPDYIVASVSEALSGPGTARALWVGPIQVWPPSNMILQHFYTVFTKFSEKLDPKFNSLSVNFHILLQNDSWTLPWVVRK
jgi:hypothetical protein